MSFLKKKNKKKKNEFPEFSVPVVYICIHFYVWGIPFFPPASTFSHLLWPHHFYCYLFLSLHCFLILFKLFLFIRLLSRFSRLVFFSFFLVLQSPVMCQMISPFRLFAVSSSVLKGHLSSSPACARIYSNGFYLLKGITSATVNTVACVSFFFVLFCFNILPFGMIISLS